MKISFIRPNMAAMRANDAMQPLVFAILSGLTPSRHERVLHDDRVEDIPLDEETDLVALTVETYTARRAYTIAAAYRQRGIPVVMGGYHATLATREVLEHADAVVVGDAESTWPRLLSDFERGRLRRIYRDPGGTSLAGLCVDRSVFQGKPYLPMPLVQFQRGCRYACDFCSIRAFYGDDLRHRPVDEVITEIEQLDGRTVFFADDNLFSDREASRELLEALSGLGVRWAAQMTIDATASDRDLELLQRSGCVAALIGFESLDPDSLRQMRKGWSLRHGDAASCVQRLREHGIMVYGTFVFGYDRDTPASLDATVEFARDAGMFLANFNPLTPTPGTPLYDRLEREGRLLMDRWWLDERWRYGSACFEPRGMTATDLTRGIARARRRFYSLPSIARRGLDLRANARNLANLGLFLTANLTSRREIANKQGRPLGGELHATHAGQA
jgi:radical SAM superfamily enzyme YgiQ (UPF0313 family)